MNIGISPRATGALLRNDLRKLGRDPVLLAGAFVPMLLALLLCFVLPLVERAVVDYVDLTAQRSTIVAGALAISAMLGGWIVGFMLLEERGQGMILALAVTPLTLRGFVIWRLLSPTTIALVGGSFVVTLGSGGAIDPARGVTACVLMALTAPLFALALVSVADNEVEGLALAKFGGLVFMLPLVTLYLDGPWIGLVGVLPPFWPIRLIAGAPWWTALVGLFVTAAWMLVFVRQLGRRSD